MTKTAIVTDSNSGISQRRAKKLGIFILPMPFMIEEEPYLEGIDLSEEEFYLRLKDGDKVATSQPSPGSVTRLWDKILKEYDEILHMPMSSALSGSWENAVMLAEKYDGKVVVCDNKRISVIQRQAALDAKMLADEGLEAVEIKNRLEEDKANASVYIMLDTLYYLKKGGRITPAAAALGTLLKLKPVLQIQGEKLDAFAKARTTTQGKSIMVNAIKNDMIQRLGGASKDNIWLQIAHTDNEAAALEFKEELLKAFPDFDIHIDSLSLSVACHIGPGALAVACCKKMKLK